MKKILLILVLTLGSIVISKTAQSQYNYTDIKRNLGVFDTIQNTLHFIWRGDTIWFDQLAATEFSSDTANWHSQKISSDLYFRLKNINGSYYRHMKIWDGLTLDLNTNRIINVDTAIDPNDAVPFHQLNDSLLTKASTDSLFWSDNGTYIFPKNSRDVVLPDSLRVEGTSLFKDDITVNGSGTFFDTVGGSNALSNRNFITLGQNNDTLDEYWNKQEITEADTTRWGTGGTFTETDPIYAADSANVLHWSDTATTIATKTDISQSIFEKELTDSENNIDVGFTLSTTTLIFYNGNAIPSSVWSGSGTQILNLSLQTKLYDKLKIKK